MINVLPQVKHLLVFPDEDTFYFLQILCRKKDNPELKSNGRVVKNYYIKNLQYLEDRYEEIKELCSMFNARACLRLNKRSHRSVALKTIGLITDNLISENYEFARKCYDRACGKGHADKNKKWILDVDDTDLSDPLLDKIESDIEKMSPVGSKIILRLPTNSGVHLITKPFDLREFSNLYPNIDVHKDNPINLYIA